MRALDGIATTAWWPDAPGSYTEDDPRVEPALGLAVLAAGRGVIGGQGKASSKIHLAGAPTPRATARVRTGSARCSTS